MQTADVAKDRHLHVRFGPEDEQRLSALAKLYEMPEAQVVRMLIKREADAKGIAVSPPSSPAPPPPAAKAAKPKSRGR